MLLVADLYSATHTSRRTRQLSHPTDRYFIPEDGDNELQPNIFLAPKSRQQGYPPTLGQIKQSFPLLGRYHFRFKTSLVPPGGETIKNHLAVWMDCIDDNMPVPVWQSQIVAKITRIGVEEEDDDDDDDDFRRPSQNHTASSQPVASSSAHVAVGVPLSHPAPTQPPARPSVAPSPPAPSFDLFGDGPSHQQQQQQQQQQQHNHANLLDTTAPAVGPTSSLFDMSYQPAAAATSSHNDFLGMTSAPSSGNYGYPPQPPAPPPQQQQPRTNTSSSVFSTSSGTSGGGGAFGDLAWK